MKNEEALCVCGHPHGAHQHYRPGTECASCECARFRRAAWWRRLLSTR
nr:hypothetical protein [uncultured Actinoplanes sp.]